MAIGNRGESPIASPCNRVCSVDARWGWCVGCGRTLDEISEWGAATDVRRLAILDLLPARLSTLRRETADQRPAS